MNCSRSAQSSSFSRVYGAIHLKYFARDLILRYSKPGELVADMFCVSGTVPLEAARLGQRVFASEASLYAVTLTQGKLQAPTLKAVS